ncbi:glutamate synthase (NADPH), homotetrameric [candidate division LCP-89 bacterium B3_LCP]|uniref:Glutamate synthase (NADPH), homotetrameric n=1 Tax=candidate division LCP-89 bacterium B3_LCP TaxID=2012998 RepID=A0A532V5K0_UNCL8|nr:MAG: glutamate synthase (NADPH), homotetrameric [candidate division LCP-89 bacterium B3_LCP]
MAKKEKIPRQAMPEQNPDVRRKNFTEVPFGYTPELAQIEASRCLFCKKPKCIDGCPVNIDIPAFIRLIKDGDFIGAAHKLKEENALPAICGRVCPQEEQCEIVCVTGIKTEPVAIGRLERFAADYEREHGEIVIPEMEPPTGKSVGIVGCGPAGLTVAGELAKLGHSVTIYEALHQPGGVLMYGIPEFRLPKAIVESEVDYVKQLGVQIIYNAVIGRYMTIDELMEDHDSVFLGTGAGLPYFMNIPGENFNGVYSANEYLTRSNLMRAYRFPEYDTPIIESKKVAVLGGGNVAMDAARTALRLGADEVTVVYRRSRKEMPARDEEIHHAEEEGINFQLLTNPTELLGDEEGWVTGMRCIRMELGAPDSSGRRRPIPIEGSEYIIEVDTVVVSIGNGANPLIPQTTPGLDTNKWGNILADAKTAVTSIPGVYAGGDIVIGAATVILAMGAGKIAAAAMHRYMMGIPEPVEEKEEEKEEVKEKK